MVLSSDFNLRDFKVFLSVIFTTAEFKKSAFKITVENCEGLSLKCTNVMTCKMFTFRSVVY